MTRDALPDDVIRFIMDRIDSVPQLEALLLMQESAPLPWTPAMLAARVYVQPAAALRILKDLQRHKLVAPTGEDERYVFQAEAADAATVRQVGVHYQSQLVRVAQLIHGKAPQAVREFARAFQVNKGE